MDNVTPPKSENTYTIFFMVVLSLVCALILSVLASILKEPQEIAKELDRNKQMLIAARILNAEGYFQVQTKKGEYVPAIYENNVLVASKQKKVPSREEILHVYRDRIQALVVDDQGKEFTFNQANIDEQKYIADYRKTGYYREPYKLVYKLFADRIAEKDRLVEGYIFPINGMGLWDAIYGFLAVKKDGNTVIGISWYDQKETPGLGANISEADWQSQFPGKYLFQESSNGQTNVETDPLGIVVIKGKVNEVLGNSPKALSAVDGMAGATLTGNGVTNAYRDVLASYRPFLIRLYQQFSKENSSKEKL